MSNPRRTPPRTRHQTPPGPATTASPGVLGVPGQATEEVYVPSRLRSNKVFIGLRNAFVLFLCGWGVHYFAEWYSEYDYWLYWFIILATWRYARFILNCIGWLLYKPAPLPKNPTYTPNRDVTVVLPTIDPTGVDFQECISTCAQNEPHQIIVITAGDELLVKTEKAVDYYIKHYPKTKFTVGRALIASKRAQVAVAVPLVQTAITVMLDDHVFWKKNFLRELLAPFEDPEIGLVGTNKKVRRLPNLSIWRRIWNMLGATYLYRHNFEVRSANYWDGGAFVISARTCALRTRIVQDPEYLAGYVDERFFFGLCGPLNPDDDNYNTRFSVRKGWRIKFQYTDDAEIETTVGVADPVHKKFLGQCTRWARTTWRSNPCSLFTDGSVWAYQPYCVYAVYLTSFTNFALFTDAALLTLYSWTRQATDTGLALLGVWIIFVKFVKVFEYYKRHPRDFWTFIPYLFFAYFHSLLKLWALFTFYDHAWTGRNLGAIKTQANPSGTEAGATAGAPAVATNLQRSMSISSTSSSLRLEREGLNRSIEWMQNLGAGASRLHKSQAMFGGSYQVDVLEGITKVRDYVSATMDTQKRILAQQDLVLQEIDDLFAEAQRTEELYKTMNVNETRNQTALARLRGQLLRLEERQRELLRTAGSEITSPPLSPNATHAIKLANQYHQRTGGTSTNVPTFQFDSPGSTRSQQDPTPPRASFLTGTMRTPQHRQVQEVRGQSGGSGSSGGSSNATPRPPPPGDSIPSTFNDSFPPPAGTANPLGGGNFNIPTIGGPSPERNPNPQDSFPPPGGESSPGDGFPPAGEKSSPDTLFRVAPRVFPASEQLFGNSPSAGFSPVKPPISVSSESTPPKRQQAPPRGGDGFPPTPENTLKPGEQSAEEFSPVGRPSESPSGFTPQPKTPQQGGTTPAGNPPASTASGTTPVTARKVSGQDNDKTPTRPKQNRRPSREQKENVSTTTTPPNKKDGPVPGPPNNPRTPENNPLLQREFEQRDREESMRRFHETLGSPSPES
ncbi:hypothetical protein B0T21DRAFT_412567 [Apiosordaria backusii]|uniref:Glycosyltransferase family 2 protein n=1 Tax=Apiosordaria backusii TaxID=314023 RepID=A0AA40BDR3_9PEZI|nr:hypothetical protein B0T21DRAFT_412567 [Apiosordaria backusii]